LAVKNIDVLNDKNKSIAELQDLGYERSFFFSVDEMFSYYDDLDKCFSCFKFHLRGTPTPMYYIGLNNGKGEYRIILVRRRFLSATGSIWRNL